MYSIAISTECVADLPKKMFEQYGVAIDAADKKE